MLTPMPPKTAWSQPEKLLERCDQLKIDRIAITDHNVIETAFEMKERAPDRVIVVRRSHNPGRNPGVFYDRMGPSET